MADDIDVASDFEEQERDAAIKRIVQNSEMKKGKEGFCEYCGDFFTRLVSGACGGCRDTYKID